MFKYSKLELNNQRIIESFWFKDTFKITESNRKPNTVTKPCPNLK